MEAPPAAFEDLPVGPGPKDVIGHDDRRLVTDTTAFPWRCLCALRLEWPDGRVEQGTGWLATRRAVVTAGHCLHQSSRGGRARRIDVVPALNGTLRPLGTFAARAWHVPDEWTAGENDPFDYGAIELDSEVPGDDASFGFDALDDGTLKDTAANIAGYPTELGNPRGASQFYHSRHIATVSSDVLAYDFDTTGGMSGAPIWLRLGERRVVVGIHTSGSSGMNSGVRIHARVKQDIDSWCR